MLAQSRDAAEATVLDDGPLTAGNSKTPHISGSVKAVLTNTVPVDADSEVGR